jgi:GNAT superfamily N-acetyltransferase
LPAEEREYRQGERDIERLLHGGLYIPRKRRVQFKRFLVHPNARVRGLARRILDEQRREAEELCRMRAAEEARAEDLDVSDPGNAGAGPFDDEETTTGEPEPPDDDDLPF